MSGELAVLWVLGGLIVLACLIFVAIFVKFVTKAAVDYMKKKPYMATAVFSIPGGIASFTSAWFGTGIAIAALIGLIVGLGIYLLVAVELGSD